MNKLKINKILLSSILSIGVLASSAMPVFADVLSPGGQVIEGTTVSGTTTTITSKDDSQSKYGTNGSDLKISVEATNVNVTVPSTALFAFNADGNTLVPSDFKVTNNSAIAGIYLEKIDLDADNSEWKVAKEGYNLKTMKVDSKNVRIKFGKKDGDMMKYLVPESGEIHSKGSVTFADGEIDIESGQTQKLNFEVERGAFSKDIAEGKAFGMTLQFRFQ